MGLAHCTHAYAYIRGGGVRYMPNVVAGLSCSHQKDEFRTYRLTPLRSYNPVLVTSLPVMEVSRRGGFSLNMPRAGLLMGPLFMPKG
jgi:hypothetical protein